MPKFLITAKVLVEADNQVAALDAAAAVIQHYDPVAERFRCQTGLIGAELRVDPDRRQAQGAGRVTANPPPVGSRVIIRDRISRFDGQTGTVTQIYQEARSSHLIQFADGWSAVFPVASLAEVKEAAAGA